MKCQMKALVVLAAILAACANIAPPLPRAPLGEARFPITAIYPTTDGPSLFQAGDSQISVALDAVVVRNGPGSWTHDAYWDEYQFRIRSPSGQLRLTRISLLDANDRRIASSATRRELAAATDEYGYLKSIAGDVTVGVVAGAAMTAAAFVPVVGHLAIASAAAHLVSVNARVDLGLKLKQTTLPAAIGVDDTPVVAFFPVAQPSAIEFFYLDGNEEKRLRIATHLALSGMHHLVDYRPPAQFPIEAVRFGLEQGYVKAKLNIDSNGNVARVDIVRTSSPVFVDEARSVFAKYKYPSGGDGRTTEELVAFNRMNRNAAR